MYATQKDKVAQQSTTSITQEATTTGQSPILVDLNRTQESLVGSMLPGSQMPGTEGPAEASAPPAAPIEVPIPPPGASDQDLRGAIQLLTQLVAAQAHRQNVDIYVAAQGGVAESKIKDFLRMNPPEFTGSTLTEDPQQFIDETHRICWVMRGSNSDTI